MFDDYDGVEAQFEDVNEYYFEDGEENPVCFSILPFQFDENDKVADCNTEKNVFLRGVADKSLCVYKKVIAWKIGLHSEKPNISVLSIENKWIKLLTPRKCYGEFVRSVLITVQMLHFVRRRDKRSCLDDLWDHLDEAFGKYDTKPMEEDLMKHHLLIKLFIEKDLTLMKSKILQCLIQNGFERTKKALGPEAQFIVNGEQHVRRNNGNHYPNGDDSGDGSDDDGRDDDHGTEQICAFCDDGGKLLSCEGPCKRSFHPTKKDGRESKCRTLGYTSAEVERMGTFLCENCKNRQHQCFRCGELEPSHGPNAKVFQCNKESCGYFYHPKCVAQLLDPGATDGACELERRIMEGMSFPCPIHWCFKCGFMENKTQRALELAVCRRCPRAYHRQFLPREISFKTKGKDIIKRAWKLSKTILIYCLDHEIDKSTRTARRNHIKFPAIPEGSKRELGNSTDRMTSKRKNNTHQATESVELPNMLHGEETEESHSVVVKNTSLQIVLEPQCAAKRLKGDPRFGQFMVGAASQNGAETMEGHKRQFAISSSYAMGEIPMSSSCAMNTETEKREMCTAEKETCLGTPYDVSRKCVLPSTKGISDPSVKTLPVDKDVELNNLLCRITEGKNDNEAEKSQDDYTGKERGAHMDFQKSQKQNHGLANLSVEKHTDGSQIELRKGRDIEWQENAYAPESISGQKKGTSMRVSSRSDRKMIPRDDSNKFDTRRGEMALYNVDHSAVKQVHAAHVDKVATTSRVANNRKCRPDEDKNVNESCSRKGEPNCSKGGDCSQAIDTHTSGDKLRKSREPVKKATENRVGFGKNNKHSLTEDGRNACYDDGRTYRNTAAADTSKDRRRGRTLLDRKEEHVRRNDPTRSRSHSPERQRTDYHESHPGTNIRHIYEPCSHVKSSRNDRDGMRNHYEDGRSNRNTEAGTSKYKHRERTASDRREEPVETNSQRISRKHSPERQRMDYRDSYSGANNGHRYEPPRHVKSSRNDHDVWRQQGRESSYSPAEFGTGRRHTTSTNLEDGEYRTSQKCVSPSYTRRHEQGTSRRHGPPPYPRTSEDVDTSRDHWYDKYTTLDGDPVSRYSSQDRNDGSHRPHRDLCVGEHAEAYARSAGGYGERSVPVHRNVSNWRSQAS